MFRGSIVALVTPFENDEVHVRQLHELIEHHISAGTQAIVVAGTTGESGTLSFAEKKLIISEAVHQARERIPIIAGTAANATRECIKITQMAMECGAHGALIMTPAYIKPTQQGLIKHYQAIAAAVPIPMILYNVPSRTAVDLQPETVAQLAEISNIVAIKEATGDLSRLQALQRLCPSMDVFSGDDLTAAQWMLAGAKGVISVTANVAPHRMAELCKRALSNDSEQCLQVNEQLMPLHRLLFAESNPIGVKWALSRMELIENELRLPLTVLSSEHHQALEQVLNNLQLI